MSSGTDRDAPGFDPPPYPYDRLDEVVRLAAGHPGGAVDLSVGTPCDPPPASVIEALGGSGSERGYPPSIGTESLRSAVSRWMSRRFALELPAARVAACIGTKEFVATTPWLLHLRRPNRDTVLYPEVSYPTYAMGATLAGLRPVVVPSTPSGAMDLSAITEDDARRALMLWVNSPSNPTGALDDLQAAAEWGRARGVPVFSDECYVEFTWDGPPRTILGSGLDGVVAVHSLSKRSNLAGLRVGFYAGDSELVEYLREVRKHGGFMVPGPAQAAGVAALDDDRHVSVQRDVYRARLERLATAIGHRYGIDVALPAGGFYLWFRVGDAWTWAMQFARDAGAVASPGEFYGDASSEWIRIAVVQPDDALEAVVRRLSEGR